MTTRRGFLTGIGALFVAAPAIVRATSLMPVKALVDNPISSFWNPLTINQVEKVRQLLTREMILRESIRLFENSNEFLRNVDRSFLGFPRGPREIGTVLRIRLPYDYQVDFAK